MNHLRLFTFDMRKTGFNSWFRSAEVLLELSWYVEEHCQLFTDSLSSQISPSVTDTQSTDPHVIELGQAVHNNKVNA